MKRYPLITGALAGALVLAITIYVRLELPMLHILWLLLVTFSGAMSLRFIAKELKRPDRTRETRWRDGIAISYLFTLVIGLFIRLTLVEYLLNHVHRVHH